MLLAHESVLIIIDVQGKLARVVENNEACINKIKKLIQIAKVLEIPTMLTAQVPEKLGSTIPEVAELLPGLCDIPRTSFSVFRNAQICANLGNLGRPNVIICGFETHICLYQSATDLLNAGYAVHLVADCTSSRVDFNKQIALTMLTKAGVHLTTVEMAMFEMLRDAKHPRFKQLASLIK